MTNKIAFRKSVRAKFLIASAVLLLIPVVGFYFVRELAGYLRSGQEQVAVAAARLTAASLSDRAEIDLRQKINAVVEATGSAPETSINIEAQLLYETELERDRIVALFQASEPATVTALGSGYQPDVQVERILNQSGSADARIWVIDSRGQVRGLAGSIAPREPLKNITNNEKIRAWISPVTSRVMQFIAPYNQLILQAAGSTTEVNLQAVRAVLGQPTVEWRRLADTRLLLSAAAPIWQDDNIVAAVVIEETDQSYRLLATRAAELVIMITLIVFVVVFGVLVAFAFRITSRLSRLQREANLAIDPQGRVRGEILAPEVTQGAHGNSIEVDEIGALRLTLRAMVSRQASYNSYLEQLAARLSHELRTPVAVVRSSLDNLRISPLSAEDKIFLSRADEGVARLSQIIARMSEATQLEHMLTGAQRERVNLVALIGSCVSGYAQTFTAQRFTFAADSDELMCDVVPDAINQMLDKLVQNAIDFAASDTAIRITLTLDKRHTIIAVENKGPLISNNEKEIDALFDSMVSKRAAYATSTSTAAIAKNSHETHLGLGLYIARLIAEFHDGGISAENLRDGTGVRFNVRLGC